MHARRLLLLLVLLVCLVAWVAAASTRVSGWWTSLKGLPLLI
jgi:hypothetical protein